MIASGLQADAHTELAFEAKQKEAEKTGFVGNCSPKEELQQYAGAVIRKVSYVS